MYTTYARVTCYKILLYSRRTSENHLLKELMVKQFAIIKVINKAAVICQQEIHHLTRKLAKYIL